MIEGLCSLGPRKSKKGNEGYRLQLYLFPRGRAACSCSVLTSYL